MSVDMDNVKILSVGKSFEELGGRPMLEKVSKAFYDKVYEHPWIGLYFKDIKQEVIEVQQVDFMSAALGGPKVYLGKLPVAAHKHMLIKDDIFDLREQLLAEALDECGACQDLKDRWQKIDEAFRAKLVKKSFDDCEKRFKTDEFLYYPNPNGTEKKAA